MCGWWVSPKAKPLGKLARRRSLAALACRTIVASGSSKMSMAVICSPAVDICALAEADTKRPKLNAVKIFAHRNIFDTPFDHDGSVLLKGENPLPVSLHINHRPSVDRRRVQRLVEPA